LTKFVNKVYKTGQRERQYAPECGKRLLIGVFGWTP
jgi:hypothetical protein